MKQPKEPKTTTHIDVLNEELNEIIDICLSIFFYWVNFGPLSRGSAACGYVVLDALLLSFSLEIQLPWMPCQIQMDWEAILRSHPKDFIKVVKPWMLPKLKRITNTNNDATTSAAVSAISAPISADADGVFDTSTESITDSVPKFNDVIVTLRDAYTALNLNRK